VDPVQTSDTIRALLERRLSWEQVRGLQGATKDPGRFPTYREVLQEHVSWDERILLAVHDHLFIVDKDGKGIVKAACGHEFGDYRVNWKLNALIQVRKTDDDFRQVFPEDHGFDPEVCELREFICPGCGTLLEVDAVPPGYPVVFEFLPDLEVLYRDWLGEQLPIEASFEDRSGELTERWVGGSGDQEV
jgi:acetone carboxylase gamma subunit